MYETVKCFLNTSVTLHREGMFVHINVGLAVNVWLGPGERPVLPELGGTRLHIHPAHGAHSETSSDFYEQTTTNCAGISREHFCVFNAMPSP